MILSHGAEYQDENIDCIISDTFCQIQETLSGPELDLENVLDASEQLASDFLSGRLEPELASFLPEERQIFGDIRDLVRRFRKKELKNRVEHELGDLNGREGLMIAPKGVLLHIAAGNLDVLPAYSVLEGLLTGNVNLLKLPSQDLGLSAFLLKKLMEYEPCLKDYIYIFDTPSSDLSAIQKLMKLSDAIVLWGSDEAVGAVRKHAPTNTEIIEWGHKQSFCYIQDLHIPDSCLEELAHHLLTTNQLLCSSCQGIYVEAEHFEAVTSFGKRFAGILERVENDYPLPDYLQGKLTLEALTRKLEHIGQPGHTCRREVTFQNKRSSVICRPDSVLELSPLYGNVWVKPLRCEKAVEVLHQNKLHLQTAGLYPFGEQTVRTLAKAGLTHICGIHEFCRGSWHQTHDGKYSLRQYVRLVEVTEGQDRET